ncbi:MAG: large-conductance mechanosensitive channel protein MscL [Oxalobacter sp.]|nr:large-conductance mechanosensitive channel protein MscL [Oxalobacter sp.]
MEEKKSFLQEFKEFALKGNVVDMAVGVIIGGAFGKIVTSLVEDILMPVIGFLVGGMDFKDMKYIIRTAVMEGDKVIKPEVAVSYGNFIQVIIDFIIIAISIFIVVKVVMRLSEMRKKEEEAKEEAAAEEAPAEPPADIQLLTEIRDLLKANQVEKKE